VGCRACGGGGGGGGGGTQLHVLPRLSSTLSLNTLDTYDLIRSQWTEREVTKVRMSLPLLAKFVPVGSQGSSESDEEGDEDLDDLSGLESGSDLNEADVAVSSESDVDDKVSLGASLGGWQILEYNIEMQVGHGCTKLSPILEKVHTTLLST
jgi:hypothetical protein